MAMQAGLTGAETWLVRARARFGMRDFAGAETAYRSAMERPPENAAARMELAQLVWMRTGDRAATLLIFDPPAGASLPVESLFASCMWHGAENFSGTDPRLTVAFDLVPS
jgi:hypothetical protein